nr:MAG TPA: deaminase [Caudoviricetes sp.]
MADGVGHAWTPFADMANYKRGGALHCPAPPCPSCQQRTIPV